MRPESIRRFDLFYLGSIAVSILVMILGFDTAMNQARSEAARSGVAVGSGVVIGSFVVGLLISLLLWYLVSRKGFAIAKWVVILLFVIGLFGLPGTFAGGLSAFEIVSLFGMALQAVAIWYLFQPDAKAWLSSSPAAELDDAAD